MNKFSVVIVCKNEADIIGKTLQSLQGLVQDIVVYDTGSKDDTITIAKRNNASVYQGNWEGYGPTKNRAVALARNDWILSLDADEALDEVLKLSLQQEPLDDENCVYEIRFRNFLGSKALHFGEWGKDKHIRLFNRKKVQWNNADVHEQLLLPGNVRVKSLKGSVLHYTMKDAKDFRSKMENYAALSAVKYFKEGRRPARVKMILSPLFSFVKNFFLKAGFLDGAAGLTCARMNAYYTKLKYKKLKELLLKA